MNFGHFDGLVIVSQFSNFQSPPPGWGLKRDFKDAFDNVSRLHISITIFFTRLLSLMRPQMFWGRKRELVPLSQPARHWRREWRGELKCPRTQDPPPASSSLYSHCPFLQLFLDHIFQILLRARDPTSSHSFGTSAALRVSFPLRRPYFGSPCMLSPW